MQTTLETKTTKQKTLAPIKRAIFYAFEDCQHAVFFNVGWAIYEELIEKYDGIGNPRLYYDKGVLEIMPLPFHEINERMLDSMLEVFAGALREDCINCGSATQKRKRLKRGFEADSSFYIGEKAALIRQRERFLETDPPPDLIFEIDVTHSSVNKLPLYAAFGVAEIWQVEKRTLKILVLDKNNYVESPESRLLPGVTSRIVNEFIADSRKLKSFEWRDKVSAWAAENLKK